MDVRCKVPSKAILFFLLCGLSLLSGCGKGLKEWDVAKCYSGPERPITEVAVLLRNDAMLETIDGARLVLNDEEEKKRAIPYTEYHLLPGKHTFETVYVNTNINGMCYKPYDNSKYVVLTKQFEKGHVYTLKGSQISEKFSTVKIVSDGTVSQMAPEIAGRFLTPTHWNSLARND